MCATLLALVAVTGAPGCGRVKAPASDGGPGDGGAADSGPPDPCAAGQDPTYDQAWTCLNAAICRVFSRCEVPQVLEDCERIAPYEFQLFDRKNVIEKQIIAQSIAQGLITYHPEQVATCVSNFDNLACQNLSVTDFDVQGLCPIFEGTVADTGACVLSAECSGTGSFCSPSGLCQQGDICCKRTCEAPAMRLSDCSTVPCAPGDHCVNNTCEAGGTGSTCGNSSDCDLDFWCDVASNNTCQPDLASGSSCTDDDQCPVPETCVGNDLQGGGMGTCALVDAANDSCDSFCFGFQCIQPDTTMLGTCTALAGEGESCASALCVNGLQCDATKHCVQKAAVDAPCSMTADCKEGLFCSSDVQGGSGGTCTAPQADNSACTDPSQCQSGLCSGAAGNPGTCTPFPTCYP